MKGQSQQAEHQRHGPSERESYVFRLQLEEGSGVNFGKVLPRLPHALTIRVVVVEADPARDSLQETGVRLELVEGGVSD
jgi:hypothetical protein